MSYENFVQAQLDQPASASTTALHLGAVVAPYNLPPAAGGVLVLADNVSRPAALEVVRYASRTGLVLNGVQRGVEGTAPRDWAAGSAVFMSLTAGGVDAILQSIDARAAVGSVVPSANGVADAGTANTAARADHVHPLQTSVSGNAGTATKLATARTINGVPFDGTADITVADSTKAAVGSVVPAANGIASAGTSATAARADHVHPVDVSRAPLVSPALTGTPTAPTAAAGTNTGQIATTAFVQTAVAGLVDAAPEALNTLSELAAALGGDPSFATSVSTQIGLKAPLASPALEGVPTAPTAPAGTNTARIATTAFVIGQAGSITPAANGAAAVGTSTRFARQDHVHPAQTSVSGNAGTATKLATARSITLSGDVTGSATFDGSANVTLTATVADDSHNHTIVNVDGLQAALDGKQATMTGAATSITSSNLATSKVLVSDSSGKVAAHATVSSTQLGYLADVTSAIQTQLDGKAASSHTHNYVPTTGGTVTGAVRLYPSGGQMATSSMYINSSTFYLCGRYWSGSASADVEWHLRAQFTANSAAGSRLAFGVFGIPRMFLSSSGELSVTGNVTSTSDERLKTDIRVIPNALTKVEQLRGVTYKRIDSGEYHTGVVAQDVQKVLPEAVRVASDEQQTLSVAYGNMLGLLIEAVKELSGEVKELKARVEELGSTA